MLILWITPPSLPTHAAFDVIVDDEVKFFASKALRQQLNVVAFFSTTGLSNFFKPALTRG